MKTIEIAYRYDSDGEGVRARPASADAARRRLDAGSRAIASLLAGAAGGRGTARHVVHVDPRDLGLGARVRGAPPQRPFAAVLGCADARVPVELVFNEGPNDLFVVRVAGNGLGAEVLGSLKYAVDHLGKSLKLVVVLGHSGCGAVTAAVDVFLDPRSYLDLAGQHALRGILDRLLVVVHAAAKRLAASHGTDVVRRPGYRAALIEAAVVSNAALGAFIVQQALHGGGLRAAYGVWVLDSREVWAPRSGSASCAGLAWPPSGDAPFAGFADAVVRSERIVRLLDAPAR
ncbi:MAG: carbonic anhydrase [Burkholderiales bacterium]